MILFHNLSWAQIVLFEVGALFQFIALCTYLRERMEYRDEAPGHEGEYEASPRRPQVTTAQHVSAYQVRPAASQDEDEPAPKMSAAHLVKTAKVKFKQSFDSLSQP